MEYYIFVVFLFLNNRITIQWLQHSVIGMATLNLPITYSYTYTAVGGGGHESGGWPLTKIISLSSVAFANRGTVGFGSPSYCVCIGY